MPDWISRVQCPRLLTAVVERDGTACALCGKPVNLALSGRHPDGPSLDHITPRSRGGTHALANLRLAHHRCNSSRGNRPGPRQPSGTPFFPTGTPTEDPAGRFSLKPPTKIAISTKLDPR